MRPAITRVALLASGALSLLACGDPLRLVLVEAAGGSNALTQAGTESGGTEAGGTETGGTESGGTETGGSAGSGGSGAVGGGGDAALWDAPTLYRASYVSQAFPGLYIRHIETEGFIGVIDLASAPDKAGASFEIIAGVWDDGCISLRAVDQQRALFRHSGSRLYMHPPSSEQLYLADATYCIEPGMGDPEGVSFRSINYPQRLIHVRNGSELWTDYIEDTPAFAAESTFYPEAALSER